MSKNTKNNIVFLDELPRWEKGLTKGKINWSKSIGHKIRFIYEDITGEIEILDYIKSKPPEVIIKYNNKIFLDKPIQIGNLLNCQLGYYLNKRTDNFKYAVDDCIKDNKRDLIITDREYRVMKRLYKDGSTSIENQKWYKYTCNKCGWTEGWIREGHLNGNKGCSCCCNPPQTVVPEINSIWKTDPWMMKWISEEDAKKYTKSSSKKIEVTCPDCGQKKNSPIYRVYQHKSIFCNCGDGVSYPEKIMHSILSQSRIEFKTQISKSMFEWCDKYRYDFYIPSLNMIIETHGCQHYENKTSFKKTLLETQNRDIEKEQLAKNNGIEHYIVIDCRYSDLDWIKNSVLNSKLSLFINLQSINWDKCGTYATNNRVKEVCCYWNSKNEDETTFDLAIKFNLDRGTIINYLNKGSKIGWTNYDPKTEMIKNASKMGNLTGKKCQAYDSNNILIAQESSVNKLSETMSKMFNMEFHVSCMARVCRGEQRHHKGFTFKYVD